jgi:hypothetical protein
MISHLLLLDSFHLLQHIRNELGTDFLQQAIVLFTHALLYILLLFVSRPLLLLLEFFYFFGKLRQLFPIIPRHAVVEASLHKT